MQVLIYICIAIGATWLLVNLVLPLVVVGFKLLLFICIPLGFLALLGYVIYRIFRKKP